MADMFRTGRTLGTTIYYVTPGENRAADVYLGVMESRRAAALVVKALNDLGEDAWEEAVARIRAAAAFLNPPWDVEGN